MVAKASAHANGPLVSCIVPVHDGERYLTETLESIRRQTWAPLELIVVDDGSRDCSAELAKPFCDSLIRKPNGGAASARNAGIAASRGSFLAFLDADDLWHSEKLARQMACFADRPGLMGCVTRIVNFASPELGLTAESIPLGRRDPVPGFTTTTLLARREAFDVVGLFDEALALGDGTDWFIRAREAGLELELLPEELVRRRLHDANISQVGITASHDEHLRLIKAALDRRRRGRPS